MGLVEHDLAAYELAMNAEQTASDLRVRELNAAFAKIGGMNGAELYGLIGDIAPDVDSELYSLLAECLRDYPPEEARDKAFLATRALRAFLAERMMEET